jgi:Tol biopolymer transport system component/imidazolonepropionase-like amidohydrolase
MNNSLNGRIFKTSLIVQTSFLICLLIVSRASSQTNKITVTVSEGTNMASAVSPDGKMIAVDLQGTIGIVPITGGPLQLLTDGMGDERQPSWSPDGSQIVFHSYRDGNYHLWMINKDGSGLKQITFGYYDEREPHWSPDGKQILFSSDRSGNYDIWELHLSTDEFRQRTKDPGNDYHPAYSPDGKRIAFVSSRSGGGLFIIDEADLESKVNDLKGSFNSPAWSLDGQRLVANLTAAGKSELVLISLGKPDSKVISKADEDVFPFRPTWTGPEELIYTADGKIKRLTLNKKMVTTPIEFTVMLAVNRNAYEKKKRDFDETSTHQSKGIYSPVVSPDGNTVAFTSLGDIWLKKKDRPAQQLTSGISMEIDAAWSSNGRTLIYSSDKDAVSMNLWIYDFEKNKAEQITHYDKHALQPSFSPDGSKVAFFLNDGYTGFGKATLYSLDLASGKTTILYKSLFTPGKPSWSADGKWVIVSALQPYSSRYREGISRVLIMSSDGNSSRYLSPLEGRSLAQRGKNGPVWSPDGTKLAYVEEGVLRTITVDASGNLIGSSQRITNELVEAPSWTGDSQSIVYLATDHLKRVNLVDGITEDIPIEIEWKNEKPKGETVIHAGKVFDGRSATYKSNVDIVLVDNRIKEIVPHQANRKGNVIDASTKTIIPGLIEMHTHQNGSGGELLGRNWLAYGITSVRETGGDPYDALERKESWSSGTRMGPRLFFTGPLLDGNRVYYELASGISSGAQLDMELDRAAKLDYDFIKTYVRFPDYYQKRATAFAHEHGIPVSSHEVYPAIAYGVDAVEHMSATSRRGYSPKMTYLARSYDDVIQLLSRSQMSMTPTVALYGGFNINWMKDPDIVMNKQLNGLYSKEFIEGTSADARHMMELYPNAEIQFQGMKKNLYKMASRGVRMTAGTDSPFITYGLSLHVELHNFVEAGLTPFQALQAATLHAAESIGVDKDLGTIEAGKLADLVIVAGDPLKNIKDALNVETVFKNGIRYDIESLLNKK